MARFLIDSVVLLIAAVLLVIVWGLLFGENVSRGSDKIDPEPPPRTPAGDWQGRWNGTRFTATLSPGGGYHESYGGVPYGGTWRYYPRSRVLEITESRVPAQGAPCLYSLTVARCGRYAGGHGGTIKMRRKRR